MVAFRTRRQNAAAAYDFLPPARSRVKRDRAFAAKPDVIDADFVTIRPQARQAFESGLRNSSGTRKKGAKYFVVRDVIVSRVAMAGQAVARFAARFQNRLQMQSFPVLLAACLALAFLFGAGAAMVSLPPSAAAQARSLDVTHVTVTPQEANGLPILLVNGIVENRTGEKAVLSQIRADVIIGGRPVSSALIDPPVNTVEAGESHGFAAKLQHPGGKNPQIRFSFTKADVPAG